MFVCVHTCDSDTGCRRITLRGLLFLKLSIKEQLKKCQLPKVKLVWEGGVVGREGQ